MLDTHKNIITKLWIWQNKNLMWKHVWCMNSVSHSHDLIWTGNNCCCKSISKSNTPSSHYARVETCRDRHDWRLCKICPRCVNFPEIPHRGMSGTWHIYYYFLDTLTWNSKPWNFDLVNRGSMGRSKYGKFDLPLPPGDPIKLLWVEMACTDVRVQLPPVSCSTRNSWGILGNLSKTF